VAGNCGNREKSNESDSNGQAYLCKGLGAAQPAHMLVSCNSRKTKKQKKRYFLLNSHVIINLPIIPFFPALKNRQKK
jgi:hypothetical protein